MFYGRKTYLDDLASLWRKRSSSLVACRGRRRVGKSTLFREFARRTADVYIEIEGLAPTPGMTNQDQLDGFAESLARETGRPYAGLSNWLEAFSSLDAAIDDSKRTVILLDEISWMGGYDPLFASTLRKAWERYFHRHDQLIFVLCGSVSAWIRKNILDNTGFTGRFSRDFVLPELTLRECTAFCGDALTRLSSREVIDILSVTGGVPRYLEEVDFGVSATENIRRMCFTPGGELFTDFDAIFNPLFGVDADGKRRMLEALVEGPLSGKEIAARCELEENGHVSAKLRELAEAGFLSDDCGKNPETGREMRVSKYRLRDNYARFYLKYVLPHAEEIKRGAFRFASLRQLPGWDTICGLQFENLIVNNYESLLSHLRSDSPIIESAAPYRHARHDRAGKPVGVQVDLLIQTPCTAYVVEVKRKRKIGTEIEREMRTKIARLPMRKGMSVRPVLVYDGELSPEVEGRGYFDALIPARRLLGMEA